MIAPDTAASAVWTDRGAVSSATDLSRTDVRCLRALLTLDRIEFHTLAVFQRFVTTTTCSSSSHASDAAKSSKILRLRRPENRQGRSGSTGCTAAALS
jgi:hypothetical protein